MMVKSEQSHVEKSNGSYILPPEIKNLISGGFAGMIAKTCVAPIDRIKILYQISNTPFHLLDVPRVISTIAREEGVMALWKGNVATMIRIFPYAGIQFMVFNKCKSYLIPSHDDDDHLHRHIKFETVKPSTVNTDNIDRTDDKGAHGNSLKKGMTPLESLLAGSAAGTVSVLLTYPLDLTRAQLAVLKKQKNKNDGFTKVLMGNYTRGGFGGLFRGISPTLIGILPYSGIAFAINEQAKRKIYQIKDREPNTIEKVLCGALSGLFSQSVTYPLEVTRRRMQTVGIIPTSGKEAAVDILLVTSKSAPTTATGAAAASITTATNSQQYALSKPPTLVQITRDLMREQGIMGFYKGLSMNWLKGPVSFGISFTVFDLIKEWITEEEQRILANR